MLLLASKLDCPLPAEPSVYDVDQGVKKAFDTTVGIKTLLQLATYGAPMLMVRKMKSGDAYNMLLTIKNDSTTVRATVYEMDAVFTKAFAGPTMTFPASPAAAKRPASDEPIAQTGADQNAEPAANVAAKQTAAKRARVAPAATTEAAAE